MSTDARRWKPILRGGIYCSPACGANCTKAAFDKATADAEALARRLGDGWQPRVWENMAWYHMAEKGLLEVYPHRGGTYTAYFQGQNFGTSQFLADAGTPEDALGNLLQDVRTFARRLEDQLSEAA